MNVNFTYNQHKRMRRDSCEGSSSEEELSCYVGNNVPRFFVVLILCADGLDKRSVSPQSTHVSSFLAAGSCLQSRHSH